MKQATEGTSIRRTVGQPAWAFILRWTIASALGWASGAVLAIPVVGVPMVIAGLAASCGQGYPEYPCTEPITPEEEKLLLEVILLFVGLLGLLVGSILGFFQWLVPRRETHKTGLWMLGSVLGVGAVFGIPLASLNFWNQPGAVEAPSSHFMLVIPFVIATIGLLVGFVQWPMFPRAVFATRSWPLLSVLAWVTAFFLALGGSLAANVTTSYGLLAGVAGFALLQSGLTGLALRWMFRRKAKVRVGSQAY